MDHTSEKVTTVEDPTHKRKRIRRQRIHRLFNTTFTSVVLICIALVAWKGPEVKERIDIRNEVSQIMMDESLRYKAYKDSLGKGTIGFGHLILPSDTYTVLTPTDAIRLLRYDYNIAANSVAKRYPWATGDVKLVLTNMSYQLGQSRLAKFKLMLAAMQLEDYDNAAAEMLDSKWARQTPNRAQRLAGRIIALDSSWF